MSDFVEILLTKRFQKDLRSLAKRYRSIRQDLQFFIGQLEAGKFMGDQISGIAYPVYKVRLKNSDIQKGKSGGYRVIYYLKTETKLILMTIYSKSDRADLQNSFIESIVKDFLGKEG